MFSKLLLNSPLSGFDLFSITIPTLAPLLSGFTFYSSQQQQRWTLIMHAPVSPQWPWSWWTRAWACGSPHPESHPAHPAPRMAPPMVLCQMDATRKGKFWRNVFFRFTQFWYLQNIPLFFGQSPIKAALRHHEVPDHLPCFLWLWVLIQLCSSITCCWSL